MKNLFTFGLVVENISLLERPASVISEPSALSHTRLWSEEHSNGQVEKYFNRRFRRFRDILNRLSTHFVPIYPYQSITC